MKFSCKNMSDLAVSDKLGLRWSSVIKIGDKPKGFKKIPSFDTQ
jgi:hypothetical protein